MNAPTPEQCAALLADNPGCVRHWSSFSRAGESPASISLLATGGTGLVEFSWSVDGIESRGNTLRCRLFCEKGEEATALSMLARRAEELDVTLQLLVAGPPIERTRKDIDLGGGASASVAHCEETYPVVWLNAQGEKWPKEKTEP